MTSMLLRSLSLWEHQREAVAIVLKYVESFNKKRTAGAALVQMPTGTGKTGVIATLARCIPSIGFVLVVAPRVALRDQLQRDLSGRFFSRLERKPAKIPKHVIPQAQLATLTRTRSVADKVVVMTIQKLDQLRKHEERLYDRLRRETSLLIFDEGHYEPALVWRQAIRAFRCPRVLFTATPYRNDLKFFDIDFDHTYSYTFSDAVAQRYIRPVEITPMIHPRSPVTFVDQVVKFYEEKFKSGKYPSGKKPRVIIRCDRQESIRQISKALSDRGLSNIALHENFKERNSAPNEHHSVPDPDSTPATYWIHQFKLLEGIDDPRFQLLALYDELRTVRSFVQQVGRVLRNPHRDPASIAFVLDHSGGRQQSLWQNFLNYDKTIADFGIEALAIGNEALLKAVEQKYPPLVYIDGRFRIPCSLAGLDPYADLQLPLSVNIVTKDKGFKLQELFQQLIHDYQEEDRIVRGFSPDQGLAVVFYVSINNSPFLRDKYFLENQFGVTILCEVDGYLCYFDSGGRLLPRSETLGGPVPAQKLRRLFQRRDGAFLTAVSLCNANPGASVVRSRSMSAVKIGSTAPTFDDHAFVCRIAEGYTLAHKEEDDGKRRRIRRYVGFGHGRISDLIGQWTSFSDYLQWLSSVKDMLETGAEPEPVFSRYASVTTTPADPTPLSVLLDISDVIDRYKTVDGAAMEIDDLCAEVKTNGKFSVLANGARRFGNISFDPKRHQYVISSRELDELYVSQDPINPEGLIRYLNSSQSFRIIPRSPDVFYTLGDFYSPLVKFGPDYDDGKMGLFHSIFPIPILGKITQEKGRKCRSHGKGWEKDCLFDLIDNLGQGSELARDLAYAEVLVCDDMGSESADFIAVVPRRGSRSSRVIFIHAKASEGAPHYCSASQLTTVCGQAQKNLGELALYAGEHHDKIEKWKSAWSGKQGVVSSRVRRGNDAEEAWEIIRRTVRDPSAEHEVWLVLGGILSKQRFEKQLNSRRPSTAAVQAAYLLFSTLTTVGLIGKLRIFCSQ
jgi:superfamily II DNA or RNA helicase